MSLARHLVVFAKAPRFGLAKRRLAAEAGDLAAWRFSDITLDRLLRRLSCDDRWTTWLAATPDSWARGGARPLAGPAGGHRVIAQGAGDLGERMARPMRVLPPGPVVIVGSDIPDIGTAHVERAFTALGNHDAVFGPAADGGYWLVGMRRRPRLIEAFHGVRWSTSHALADTLANLDGASYALLDRLEDIDTAAALDRLRQRPRRRYR